MLYDSPMNTINPYQPMATNSYFQFQNQQQGDQIVGVNGLDGAKAFPTKPNSRYALFDTNDDVMFIKTTDAGNFPTIKRYRYVEEKEALKQDMDNRYVTVDEFEKFKKEILNGQQSIRNKQSSTNQSGK